MKKDGEIAKFVRLLTCKVRLLILYDLKCGLRQCRNALKVLVECCMV